MCTWVKNKQTKRLFSVKACFLNKKRVATGGLI